VHCRRAVVRVRHALVTLVAGSFIAGLSLLPGLSPRR
jgi:hypothetical protein